MSASSIGCWGLMAQEPDLAKLRQTNGKIETRLKYEEQKINPSTIKSKVLKIKCRFKNKQGAKGQLPRMRQIYSIQTQFLCRLIHCYKYGPFEDLDKSLKFGRMVNLRIYCCEERHLKPLSHGELLCAVILILSTMPLTRK
ncbi:hypothetical protein AVEN_39411-1, partial [Araneus ventricosus]